MIDSGSNSGPMSLADYGGILGRRRWTVIAMLIGVPIVAVLVSSLQTPVYRASADVLLSEDNLAIVLSGVSNPSSGQDPQRRAETQSKLARTPSLARAAILEARVRMKSSDFLASTAVSTESGTDILTFSATSKETHQAIALANAYARAYTAYRNGLNREPVRQALASVNSRIERRRAAGDTSSETLASLLQRQQQLESLGALGTDVAVLVQPAESAEKIRPRLILSGVLGIIVGLLCGVGLALGREVIEKRPRSTEELQRQVGLPVLGRIPSTPEGGVDLVALSHPDSLDAEAYRLLRMNFEYATAELKGGAFVVTSALEGEGKSTVSANLAAALARAGHDVILVDGDFLRPSLRERLRVRTKPGLVDVATGRRALEAALVTVRLPTILVPPSGQPVSNPSVATDVAPSNHESARVKPVVGLRAEKADDAVRPRQRRQAVKQDGRLRVLVSDAMTLELSEYIVTRRLESLLDTLRREAEIVIVDAPPLTTSVAVGLTRLVDGVLVVANTTILRRPMLEQLAGMLAELPAPRVGLVLTGLSPQGAVTYGYYSARPGSDDETVGADLSREAGEFGRRRVSSSAS